MPRPSEPCAKCVRETTPGCDHLGNAYDHYFLKTRGKLAIDVTDSERADADQELVIYALNRMLALDRDNGNKAEGKRASRIYHSRNVVVSDALSKKCHVRKGPLGCMRNAGHEGDHKF